MYASARTSGSRRSAGTSVAQSRGMPAAASAAKTVMVASPAMRVAVISDIHANLHAFEAVLAEIDKEEPDALWCLGDLVGYGPQPNPCCELTGRRAEVCLAGNHDLTVLGRLDLAEFTGDAAAAARWTQTVLAPEARGLLESLPSSAGRPGAELFHASPRDPVWEYVLTEEAAIAAFQLTTAPLVLVGHSHVALALLLQGDELAGGLAPDRTDVDLGAGRWLLNPGSVGQPRDGDPRAAWLLVDFERRFAQFHRVAYPIERTQAEIRERGLPEPLAARLAHGQ
jgi:diadenosine tetraphosphatase ApaH/serine/threonine PP2A family protein phosphatase